MKKKILIVDDEPEIVEVLRRFLERKGYEVLIAMDGEIALQRTKQDLPDLLILDLNLPKLSGEQVCREIRANELTKKIPIVMLTGKSSDADKVIGRVIGADRYLTKPFEIDSLLKVINGILKKSS
jgi:DNA-binding response OmpR family regulator